MMKRVATLLGLAVVLGLAAAVVLRAPLIELIATSTLDRQGFGPSRLTVTRANLSGLEFEALSLSSGQIKADTASVTYAWSLLRDGRVEHLQLSGLDVSGTWTEDGVTFGGLSFPQEGQPESEAGKVQNDASGLPFRSLEIENAALHVLHPQGPIDLILSAKLQNNDEVLETEIFAELAGPDLSGRLNLSGSLRLQDILGSSLSGMVKLTAASFAVPGSENAFSADVDLKGSIEDKAVTVSGEKDMRFSVPWPGQFFDIKSAAKDQTVEVVVSKSTASGPLFRIQPTDSGYRAEVDMVLRGETPLGRGRAISSAWATFGTDGLPQDFSFETFNLELSGLPTAYGTVSASLDASGLKGPIAIAGGPVYATLAVNDAVYGDLSGRTLTVDMASDFRLDGLSLVFQFEKLTAAVEALKYGTQLAAQDTIELNLADGTTAAQTANVVFGADGSATLTFDTTLALTSKNLELRFNNSPLLINASAPEISLKGYWTAPDQTGDLQVGLTNGLIESESLSATGLNILIAGDLENMSGTYLTTLVDPKDTSSQSPLLRLNGDFNKTQNNYNIQGSMRLPSRSLIGTYSLTYASDSASGSASASIGPLLFGGENLAPSDLRPLGLPFTPTAGEFAADISISFNGGEFKKQQAHIYVKEMDVEGNDFALRRLNTAVAFDSVVPLRTDGPQSVAIGLLQAGIPVTDFLGTFALDSTGTLEVDQVSMSFAGGEVTGGPLSLRLDQEETLAELSVTAVSLPALASMTELDGLEATGTLSGRIPIIIRGSNILIESGKLKTSGPGVVKYRTSSSADTIAADQGGLSLALQALQDFRYDSIEVTVSGSVQKELEASLAIKGRNPDLYDGYPIDFNLNLSGELANIIRGSMAGYRVPEAIKRQLMAFPPSP
ncbi:MAG: YdbH domain-containing protein [Rhodospirillaceae bacterium]